ncbi:MAG: thiamine pyrophosphate-binding protein [Lachnospiraceae bacterium]|nr:thiamine pyrophosphate-binding protein [Lachnospiraceae bacterium]
MRIKVSDYIANFLCEKNINTVFTVVGGGAMHLNDSFGHHEQIRCIYNHHEQACAMAAEGYAKYTNVPAVVCVTSGPGAINALNGIAGAYQDSAPMLVFTGQVKRALLEKESGLELRTLGGQEFDIVSAVGKMTKYAETVMDPEKIRCYLEKMYYMATTGRKGPCLLDIPIDVQGAYIETEFLESYDFDRETLNNYVDWELLVDKLEQAERPIIYAGNGIRYSGGMELFRELIEKYQIPVVTCWDSIDLIETDHPLYCGRAGIMGDRPGNFAVQNSDFLLCIGNRLSIYQVGYNISTWARGAYVVAVDIDENELKKPIIRVDLPICMDAKAFMDAMIEKIEGPSTAEAWRKQCLIWKEKYPVVMQKQRMQRQTNVYAFIEQLSKMLPDRACTVVSNGSASVVGSAAYFIGKDSRFIMNCAMSSMGYGLPAAIGAGIAMNGKQAVVCIEGDGSIMMNLQELATVVANRLPIKIFVINNNGYHQIRQTQTNIFGNGLVGVGPESKDLLFPNFEKLSEAFGIIYKKIVENSESDLVIREILRNDEPVLCEVFVDIEQKFEPKSATKRLPDGSLYSPPLEDLAPFLSREELKQNMYIPMIEE